MAAPQSRILAAGFAAGCGALMLFAWLAGAVMRGATIRLDTSVRDTVHSWATPRLTYVMRGITQFGSTAVLLLFTTILVWALLRDGRRTAAVIVVAGVGGAEILDQLLKLLFHRARPEVFIGEQPLSYSFPSGHAVASCCFYGIAAAILSARIGSRLGKALVWIGAALLVVAIGLSRVYLGVHYPSDVMAGYAGAVVWVTAVRAAYEISRRRVTADSSTSPQRPSRPADSG